MIWTWDPKDNRRNRRAHGVSFEIAQRIFDDPRAVSRLDPRVGGMRWQTVGIVDNVTLFVVHTRPETDPQTGDEVGRIVCARKATAHEKKVYEHEELSAPAQAGAAGGA